MYPEGTKAREAEKAMRYGPKNGTESERVAALEDALQEARENMKAACMSVVDGEARARISALSTEGAEG
jgi:hypothetical protein